MDIVTVSSSSSTALSLRADMSKFILVGKSIGAEKLKELADSAMSSAKQMRKFKLFKWKMSLYNKTSYNIKK